MSEKICIGNNSPNSEYYTVGYRKNIDDFAENAECLEIYAPDILDFVPDVEREDFVSHLVSKLRHNGELVIGGTDIVSISLSVFNKSISIEKANELIFGSKNQPPKQSLSSLEQLRNMLLKNGLRIIKQIPGLQMTVVARRI